MSLTIHHTSRKKALPWLGVYPGHIQTLILMKTVKDKFMILKGRVVLVVLMILCSVEFVSAAGNGLSGINEATTMVTSYFEPGVKLIYAIGAVVGLIGGVKCYSKWSSGDPDTSKTAASWFGACIFLIVAATILKSFFL